MVKTEAILTCPECGRKNEVIMPLYYCQIIYQCPDCGFTVTPKEGDCCVFCSFADIKCPPKQNFQNGQIYV